VSRGEKYAIGERYEGPVPAPILIPLPEAMTPEMLARFGLIRRFIACASVNRWRWVAALGGWVLIAGAAWLVAVDRANRIEAQAQAAALARAEVGTQAIEQTLLRTLELVTNLHKMAQVREQLIEAGNQPAAAQVTRLLDEAGNSGSFGVVQVAIIGADGWLEWSSIEGGPQHVYLGDRQHFQVHQAGRRGLYISAPVLGRVSGRDTIQATRPLLDREDRFAGVVVVSIDVQGLCQYLAELQFGIGARILVVRDDGVVLARNVHVEQAVGRSMRPDGPLMTALRHQRSGHFVSRSEFDGRPLLVGFRAVPGTHLAVSVALDAAAEKAAQAFIRPSLYAAAAAISLLSLALTGLALMWLERRRTQGELHLALRSREAALASLAQAQRMEAIGRLAGGIAHDFNNVLQTVMGAATLLADRPDDGAMVRRMARLVNTAAERGAAICSRLLVFARRGKLVAEPVEIGPLLEEMWEMLAPALGASNTLVIEPAPDLPCAGTDRAQLETVLLNLAINARDAMEPGGGVIRLAAEPEEVAAGAAHLAGLAPGRYVRLRVSDTGSGMDAETLARVGEPFFTTKPAGKGTGLGLSMAKGFTEQSGGALRIESAPGRGTTVTVWLPAIAEAGPSRQREDATVAVPVSVPESGILLVDDDTLVCTVLAETLRRRGHSVAEAHEAAAALASAEALARLDLAIVDFAMPGLNGLDLIRGLRARRPGLPALLITGHADAIAPAALAEAARQGPFELLRKPVAPDELASQVTAILSGSAQAATV
jgi:signal transduction histidine kinase/ActR/RegA family two-component response regulator